MPLHKPCTSLSLNHSLPSLCDSLTLPLSVQKLDILQRQVAALQDKLAADALDLQSRLAWQSGNSADRMADVADFGSDRMIKRQAAAEAALEGWKAAAEANAGNFQDMLGKLMEKRAAALEKKWGL